MDGTEDPPLDDLVDCVERELLDLRGAHGRFTMEKLTSFPTLVRVCGDGDLADAFMALRRELLRFTKGSKYEAAAAWSILANADAVTHRLNKTAEALQPDEDPKDQRTMRHWSDRGVPRVAHDLVYFASIRGRLGQDVICLELHGGSDDLTLLIEQIVPADLVSRAPRVTVCTLPDDDNASEESFDLERHRASQVRRDGRVMHSHEIPLVLPASTGENVEARLVSVAVETRQAPTPTLFFEDRSTLPSTVAVRLAVYRSTVVLDLSRTN